MMSTGRLAVGGQSYYLEQAHGPVTKAGAVMSGVEDYYLDGPEAPGRWLGGGAAVLGLAGAVETEQLTRVLAGEHPGAGFALGRVLKDRRPGFDCTFSAPKSVSVLFGLGDPALRDAVVKAHEQAVREALKYLEHNAAVARRGPGGVQAIGTSGFVAAAFRHRTSRAGDPRLHTHVLVANLVRGEDGRWSTSTAGGCTPTTRRLASSTRRGCARCDRDARRRVDAGAQRHRRRCWHLARRAAGVQPAQG